MVSSGEYRQVRSFVRREGRLTAAQKRALQTLWNRYGIDATAPTLVNLDQTFGRQAERILEIGFGNGEILAQAARLRPDADFLGIEVHRPGVGHLLQRLADWELTNVRVFCYDAVEVVRSRLAPASLDRVNIYFPDPWPKKRHHKRRLIQPSFVRLLALVMKPGAVLHLASDWESYAQQMLSVLEAEPRLINLADGFAPRSQGRPASRFERRGERLGHVVHELLFKRLPDQSSKCVEV